MVRAVGNGNPFRPGAGRMPPVLAGRDAELALAEKRLQELAAGGTPSRGLLLYGPRGNGKSVLLRRIAERAHEVGLRPEDLPAGACEDRAGLVGILQERAQLTGGRLTGLQFGPFGGAAERRTATQDVSLLFPAWVQASPSPLVVLLDEVQTLDPSVGKALFGATHTAGSRSLPFFLIAAGTPGAPRQLRRAGTFTERDLQRLPIGRLDAASTAAALVEPAETAGRPMSEDALGLLSAASQQYPYFIQLLGSAAWDAAAEAGKALVSAEAAERGIARAQREMEQFYAERLSEAEEHGLRRALEALALLFAETPGSVSDAHLEARLDRAAGKTPTEDWISLRTSLTDLGILWEVSSGVWQMGIPSLGQYVLRRRSGALGETQALPGRS